MLNRLESLTQNVGGNNDLVDQWLQARKQLLVAYYTLVGVKPNKGKHTPLNEKALENLCHNLLDYLSAGHFHIYDKIIQQVEGAASLESTQATRIYPKLQHNTEQIMAFHDRYSKAEMDDDLCLAFHQSLSDIGEMLEARFELEDQLIRLAIQAWQQNRQAANHADTLARPVQH